MQQFGPLAYSKIQRQSSFARGTVESLRYQSMAFVPGQPKQARKRVRESRYLAVCMFTHCTSDGPGAFPSERPGERVPYLSPFFSLLIDYQSWSGLSTAPPQTHQHQIQYRIQHVPAQGNFLVRSKLENTTIQSASNSGNTDAESSADPQRAACR